MTKKRSLGQKAFYLLWVMLLVLSMVIPLRAVPVAAADPSSNEPPPGYAPVTANAIQSQTPAEWAIIEEVLPWGSPVNESVLSGMGVPFDVIKTSTLAATDLSRYHKIIIASDQTNAAYANLAANQAKLAAWVAGGGVLIAHACDNGHNLGQWTASFLPGMVNHATGFFDNTLEIVPPPHPVLAGITDADLDNWNWSTHGSLGNLVTGTRIITKDSDQADAPTYIQYHFGNGLVLATMQTVEWAYVSPLPPPVAKNLLPNEISYALATQVYLAPAIAWDVLGSQQRFEVRDVPPAPPIATVMQWRFVRAAGLDDYALVAGGQPGDRYAVVQSFSVGELHIAVDIDYDGDGVKDKTLNAEKKWGEISRTDLKVSYYLDSFGRPVVPQPGQDGSQLVWVENLKKWIGGIILDETVFGTFRYQWGSPDAKLIEHAAGHAVVHWWALNPAADISGIRPPNCPADPAVLKAKINALPRAQGVGFKDVLGDTYAVTESGPDGFTAMPLTAFAEGRVLIVLLAEYPVDFHGEHTVCPEFVTWNFWTQQLEKVPQVRWAGEQIIFEKYFGENFAGYPVNFVKEAQSPGGFDDLGTQSNVWTIVGPDGIARASYLCEDQGEVDVNAILYDVGVNTENPVGAIIINKHGFVVFYLKMEGVSLGNVDGKRMNHNAGLWTPENPWDNSTDVLEETLNVSEDTLLRARAKGWFRGDNQSLRGAGWVDTNGNGQQDPTDELLPAGRWILPDDWQYLAGPNWKELRPHWDIMDAPNDNINSVIDGNGDKAEEVGPYVNGPGVGPVVSDRPVIGPYSSLDDYTPPVNNKVPADPTVTPPFRKTLVPNKDLNWWDCPMPPAKLIFKITSGVGFFKETDKGDIYYKDARYYTNPFYRVEIPASALIPPYVNNGGYDWDSWGRVVLQGPYDFWHVFNYLPNADVPAEDNMHPTKVEVYTDNHGEAMVYLNGDANLKLPPDYYAAPGTVVGSTAVKAIADYPYLRKHPAIDSNAVRKTWTWGKEIAIRVRQVEADPLRKRIYLYVTDRDGMPVIGEKVDWSFDSAVGLIDSILTPEGWKTLPGQVRAVTTYTVSPGTDPKGSAEYGNPNPLGNPTSGFLNPLPPPPILDETQFYPDIDHGMTGITVYRSEPSSVDIRVVLHEREGLIVKDVYLNFAHLSPADPTVQLKAGMWNEIIFRAPTVPIGQALSSIPSDVEVTVWSSSGQGYNSKAPAWASDLKQFNERMTYYIWVSRDITWTYGN